MIGGMVVASAIMLAMAAAPASQAATSSHPTSAAGQAKSAEPWDFNGDGRQDLLSDNTAGEIVSVAGTANGLSSAGEAIRPTTKGMPPTTAGQSDFGYSETSADFNRDGYADVAVVDDDKNTITVLFGSKDGLTTKGSYSLGGPNEYFDGTVKAADVNDDGWPDLIAQTTDDNEDQVLTVFYGSTDGFSDATSYQIPSPNPILASFGDEIATGNINGDQWPDLVVGGHGEYDPDDGNTRGATWYCPGTPTGPTTCYELNSPNLNAPGSGSVGGVAIANVVGNHYPDVITSGAGIVTVYQGSKQGLNFDGVATTFDNGAKTYPVSWPFRSAAIWAGKLEAGKYDEVVLGEQWWHHGSGRVLVLKGSKPGLDGFHSQFISEGTKGVPGSLAKGTKYGEDNGDRFGTSLSVLNVNGTGKPDLLIGAPAAPGTKSAEGAVYFIKGTTNGPTTNSTQRVLETNLKGLGNNADAGFGSVIGESGSSMHY